MAFDVTNPKLNSGYPRYLPLTRRVEHRGVAMCRLSGRTLTKFRVIQDEEPSYQPQPQLKLRLDLQAVAIAIAAKQHEYCLV
jgi:hypothetical protein